jgi:quercetin dioxygenase-like cupin family protein
MREIGPKHSFTVETATTNIYHGNIDEGLNKHEHLYSHVTYCAKGKILIKKEGKQLEMTITSKPVLLKANEWHEVEILEDDSVFVNIFAQGKY